MSSKCNHAVFGWWWFSHLLVSDSLQPHGLQPARLLCPWDFPARVLKWVGIPFSRGSSPPKDQTLSSAFQADSLLTEPPEKPGIWSGSILKVEPTGLVTDGMWGVGGSRITCLVSGP